MPRRAAADTLQAWACTCGPPNGGTRTARWCATTRWPRTCATPGGATSRPGWCTTSAAPTDRLDRAALERLVASIRRVLAGEAGGPVVPAAAADIAIEASFGLGVVHVTKALWARLGIGEAIQARLDARQLRAPHATALLAMVAQRLDQIGRASCRERV